MINGRTRLFGILGNPVAHSLSPALHNAAFKECRINAVYVPLAASDLEAALGGIKAFSFAGVSVTVPHKVAIMPLLDAIDPVAEKIGAVNTLVFKRKADGRLHCTGLNTDWIGANASLAEAIRLSGASALILGAGGAARAVAFGLQEAGVRVLIHNRSEDRGRKLATQLDCPYLTANELHDLRAEILVNATSVGMEPETDAIPLEADLLSNFQVVMDIVYAPVETRLLREAAARGCKTVPGTNMLLYQATAQWRLWLGEEAPVEVMRAALTEGLSRQQE